MLSIVFVNFQTLTPEHMERALFSLTRQTRLDLADELVFVDNNTWYDVSILKPIVDAFDWPFPVHYHWCKHGKPNRRHSWSANYGIRAAQNEFVFFTRADFILAEDAMEQMTAANGGDELIFVSGWSCRVGVGRESEIISADPVYEAYAWRTNVRWLLQAPDAHDFFAADLDAGVFLTSKAAMDLGGWYDEAMVGFGFQQSTLQRHMRNAGVKMVCIQDYLFFHQNHGATRDFDISWAEYRQSRGG